MGVSSFLVSGSYEYSLNSVGGLWYWTVQSTNIANFGQTFQVIDITSPFGKITDVSVPIPGDVICCMCDGVQQLQNQFSALISIIFPDPAVFYITVTEGDPITVIGPLTIQNSGAFGSFLTAAAIPGAPWLLVAPNQIVGLQRGATGSFNLSVNPATLLAVTSPYQTFLNIQDVKNTSTIVPATVNVTVLPRPILSVVPTIINLVYDLSNSILPGVGIVTVSNIGPISSILNFVVAKVMNISPWLTFTPISGGPLGAGDSTQITFSVITTNLPQISGTYTEVVRVTSTNATPQFIEIQVNLQVILPAC